MRSEKTEPKTSSIASAVWHVAPVQLKPNVASILLFNFCEQKFIQHDPITIAIDCNSLSLVIFEEICFNYASAPKSAAKSDTFWMRRLFNICVRVFCDPNATILLVYLSAKIKMSFIRKDDFFFTKVGIFCKSIDPSVVQAYSIRTIFVLRKDKTNYLSNQT